MRPRRIPMSLKKAVKVAELGPKTEAQRRQAIQTLRCEARSPELDGLPNTVQDLRDAAANLAALGDINKR